MVMHVADMAISDGIGAASAHLVLCAVGVVEVVEARDSGVCR